MQMINRVNIGRFPPTTPNNIQQPSRVTNKNNKPKRHPQATAQHPSKLSYQKTPPPDLSNPSRNPQLHSTRHRPDIPFSPIFNFKLFASKSEVFGSPLMSLFDPLSFWKFPEQCFVLSTIARFPYKLKTNGSSSPSASLPNCGTDCGRATVGFS